LFLFKEACFSRYVQASHSALLEEIRQEKAANVEKPVALAVLMEQVAASDASKVLEADKQSTVLESTGPRRSQRLAEKERQNYALAVPWWLRSNNEQAGEWWTN
jgi:hypothetical protein